MACRDKAATTHLSFTIRGQIKEHVAQGRAVAATINENSLTDQHLLHVGSTCSYAGGKWRKL